MTLSRAPQLFMHIYIILFQECCEIQQQNQVRVRGAPCGTGTGYRYGVRVRGKGAGTGTGYGVQVRGTGAGTGTGYGVQVRAWVRGTGTGFAFEFMGIGARKSLDSAADLMSLASCPETIYFTPLLKLDKLTTLFVITSLMTRMTSEFIGFGALCCNFL